MLARVGNVTVPTPVFVAGGALCLLAGYLVGTVTGPNTPDRTTAMVQSFDNQTGVLCLSGEAASDQDGARDDGTLCGQWRRAGRAPLPSKGDDFRFVTIRGSDRGGRSTNLIYGNVVG